MLFLVAPAPPVIGVSLQTGPGMITPVREFQIHQMGLRFYSFGRLAQGDLLLIIKPDLVVASLTSVLEPLTKPQPDSEATQGFNLLVLLMILIFSFVKVSN
jgi:hypothetical protein